MASRESFKIFLSRRITFVHNLNLLCNSRCSSTLAQESFAAKSVKPFDEIPGPTAVPVLGTLWQYYSGKYKFDIWLTKLMKMVLVIENVYKLDKNHETFVAEMFQEHC